MLVILAINETYVAAAEDISITLFQPFRGADGAKVNVDVGLSENVTVGVALGLVLGLPVVKASAAAEYIADDMATPHGYVGFAGLVYSNIEFIGRRILCLRATSDGCNLAATIHAVADDAVPQSDIGYVNITIGCIATAKGVTCFVNDVVANSILVYLFYVKVALAGQVIIVM